MATSSNISNLNVLTFIKDIYNSLKYMEQSFNKLNEQINTRMGKIEDNQQIILSKLENINVVLNKINENTQQSISLDKNIENELLTQINKLNISTMNNNNEKLDLKPKELTIANILENNYTILDINHSIQNNTPLATELGISTGIDNSNEYFSYLDDSNNKKDNKNTIENLLFE